MRSIPPRLNPLRRALFVLLPLALAALVAACAPSLQSGAPPATSPERDAMPPEYRVFYDALRDDGDWVLIEPYGFVFRPRVIFDAWQPYQQGFWVPSDVYGWVWISTEPFGWATYHYGRWAYDQFQGWIWMPDVYWAPAWVTWEASNQYVGWAPMLPPDTRFGDLPPNARSWIPIEQMGATDLQTRLVSTQQMTGDAMPPRPIHNYAVKNGVQFNRGPSFEDVERITGPQQRVRITEINPMGRPRGGRSDGGAAASPPDPAAQIEATQRAAQEAASQARSISSVGARPPVRIQMIRPVLLPPGAPGGAGGTQRTGPKGRAQSDSTSR